MMSMSASGYIARSPITIALVHDDVVLLKIYQKHLHECSTGRTYIAEVNMMDAFHYGWAIASIL